MKRITNEELVKLAREYCGITRYGKGMQCCALTQSVINSKASQSQLASWYKGRDNKNKNIPSNMNNKQYLESQIGIAKYGADCCGLIKGIGYGNRVNGPTTLYIGADDITIEAMSKQCKNIKKDVTQCEPGEFIWTKDFSHCAIVSVKGLKDIESAGSLDGVQEVSLGYQGCGSIIWAGGGELPWVDYIVEKPEQKFEVGAKVTIDEGALCGGLSSTRGKNLDPKYTGGWVGTISKLEVHKGDEEALIKELVTWVATKYLNLVEGAKSTPEQPVPATQPKTEPTPAQSATSSASTQKFQIGDKIKIRLGAVYGGLSSARGKSVPSKVLSQILTIDAIETHKGVQEAKLKEIVSWVALDSLELVVKSSDRVTKKVTVGLLNVRKGPGMNYAVVRTLTKGNIVDVYETKPSWTRIGANEWVWSEYIG